EDRARIRDAKLPPEQRFWDLKGELRRSMAFPDAQNRFRLYDPTTSKTVAYVDIPPTSGIDATQYLSQYVGIRVSSQYFSTAAKVTIGVANEIARLPMAMGPSPTTPAAAPSPVKLEPLKPAAVETKQTEPPTRSQPPAAETGAPAASDDHERAGDEP